MFRTLSLLLAIFLTLGAATDAAAGTDRVLAVLSSDNAFYRKFLDTYRKTLSAAVELSVVPSADSLSAQSLAEPPDLILSIGSAAARQVHRANPSAPVVYAMVQRRQFEESLKGPARHDAAVFIDPTWAQQAELARLVLPGLRSIGVVYSAESRMEMEEISKTFRSRGIAVAAARVEASDKLYEALQDVLIKCDALLAIQDATLYNPSNIRNILLTSFRYGKPLIGLSGAYVRAGALYSLAPTPETMAADAAVLTHQLLGLPPPPVVSPPGRLSIEVNRDVARTLGFDIPAERILEEQLRKRQERKP